jgi:hypothetical protein
MGIQANSVKQISMSVSPNHVGTVEHAMMSWPTSFVTVLVDLQVIHVKQMLMNATHILALMVQPVWIP